MVEQRRLERERLEEKRRRQQANKRTLGPLAQAAKDKGLNVSTVNKRYHRYIRQGMGKEEAFDRALSDRVLNQQEIGRAGARKRWSSLKGEKLIGENSG